MFIDQESSFFEPHSTGRLRWKLRMYWEPTYNVDINKVCTRKGYDELLVLLFMLFAHIFIHIRECGRSTQVGVEHTFSYVL